MNDSLTKTLCVVILRCDGVQEMRQLPPVIAERVLEAEQIFLRVHLPELHEPTGDWANEVSAGDFSFLAFGVDSLQAVRLALVALEVEVRSRHENARFCGQAREVCQVSFGRSKQLGRQSPEAFVNHSVMRRSCVFRNTRAGAEPD
jgi:hypothetical protein